MSNFLRWFTLIAFAACGAGVAVCLALTAVPAEEPKALLPSPVSSDSSPLDTRLAVDVAAIPSAVRRFPEPPMLLPTEPIVVQAAPAVTQQAPRDVSSEEILQKIHDKLQSALAAQAAPPALALPAEDEPEVNQPLPAPRRAAPSETSSQAVTGQTRVQGEGDDHLTIHIQDDDIRRVLEMISVQGGMNILPSPNVRGTVSASLIDVDIETAMAAILRSTGFASRREGNFIYVGTPEDLKSQRNLIDTVGTRIYRPQYVRAAELKDLITPLLSPDGVGGISVSTPAEVGIGADNNKVGGDGYAGGEAVVVRDYDSVLNEIDQVFHEVDRKPMQVAIEAMILSVELDDENKFGVDFEFLRQQRHVRLASGSPLADLGGMSYTDGGMKFGFLDSSLGAFVDALETVGDTSVVASPRLLCLNKHRAEILIGQQLGYISTTVTETSTAQSVEFLEVGTQLRLRPFISPDGLIRMEVHPELSTGSVQVRGDFTLPEKEVTQVTTNIMVPDGCTMIIGGLMREDLGKNTGQIPFLGDIPGVGFLFRSKNETRRRSEILVLITPRIVDDGVESWEGEHAAADFHRRHDELSQQMSPWGRRHMARRYFRLANDAWQAGNCESARTYIDLSIRFDPINREAIDLRTKMLGGHSARCNCGSTGDVAHPVDGEDLAPWVLEELERGPATPSAAAPSAGGSAEPSTPSRPVSSSSQARR